MTNDLIPSVDLRLVAGSSLDRQSFDSAIVRAFSTVGFVRLTHTVVTAARMRWATALAQALFDLPEWRLMEFHRAPLGGQAGYVPMGRERYEGRLPEQKRMFTFPTATEPHPVFGEYPRHFWPRINVDDDLGRVFPVIMRDLADLGLLVVRSLLQDRPGYEPYMQQLMGWDLLGRYKHGDTILRVVHYPPVADAKLPGLYRAGPHCDTSMVTVMPAPSDDGLEIYGADRRWHAPQFEPGDVIVNSGKVLRHISAGWYKPRKHRVVIAGDGTTSRFAFPCFVWPAANSILRPLSRFPRVHTRRYPAITAAEFLRQDLARHNMLPPR